MDAKTKEEKEHRLSTLLGSMDVPLTRKMDLDLGWLARNLGIRNREHKNFEEAMKLITELLREEMTNETNLG